MTTTCFVGVALLLSSILLSVVSCTELEPCENEVDLQLISKDFNELTGIKNDASVSISCDGTGTNLDTSWMSRGFNVVVIDGSAFEDQMTFDIYQGAEVKDGNTVIGKTVIMME